MLQKNKNEFEMNGVKYKLNVESYEIESMLSMKSERTSTPGEN